MGKYDTLKRLGHIIGGMLAAVAASRGKGLLAMLLFIGFLMYEIIEYIQLGDTLWRDVQDYIVGLYIGALVLLALQIRKRKGQEP